MILLNQVKICQMTFQNLQPMKMAIKLVYPVCLAVLLNSGCSAPAPDRTGTGGPEVVTFAALPFPLQDVRLLDGPFLHATGLDKQTLLAYDPDRLLSRFYSEAGLTPKAEHYMGWENESLAGHSLGHYLSACSMMYLTTGDTLFRHRAEYITDELEKIQDHTVDGYIGAFPKGREIFVNEVSKGNIRSQGFDLNGIWSPFYTMHKILAGLRDTYHCCGYEKALTVEKKFAGWILNTVSPLSDEQVQLMLRCEHGGINETFADLYADTGDDKYLKLAGIFYHKSFLDALKEHKDILPGKHANTNIPKLIGLARIYELTGDTSDKNAAGFFWQTVVNHHSYVTGGNGNDEYFGPPDTLRDQLGEGTTESCNVYNMLKLSEHLFEWEASPRVADFYERALFNHILSSQNPVDGRVVYNLSLDMGGFKNFQDPLDFTCCIGTGMENHSKYGRNIYYHTEKDLFLFQYIASELHWKEKGLTVIQRTGFPTEPVTELELRCEKPVKLALQVRYPGWATGGIEVRVNGHLHRESRKPGSWVCIEKTWKSGDRVVIKIPFSLRLEPMPDDSTRAAVMYGPLVLAGELGPLDDTASKNPLYVPVLLTSERDPAAWLKPVEGKPNTFVTVNTGRPRDVELKPFYSIYDRRYTIYWDLFTRDQWEKRLENYRAEEEQLRKLKESTVDFVQPGEMQPERDHKFRGENTTPEHFRDRAYRESRGGWFSFEMKADPAFPLAIVADYWGGFPGAKTFDILIDGRIIATENISGKKPGQFIRLQYDIPAGVTKAKQKLTVRFQAHKGNTAGPVFGVRVIKQGEKP